mmetsp:Transcript_60510/g.143867  ORF Transcript_60510/g.143867 Transcript_60510/m.143867 type:complete len:245 (-) Transcript_60510:388-1122(-)
MARNLHRSRSVAGALHGRLGKGVVHRRHKLCAEANRETCGHDAIWQRFVDVRVVQRAVVGDGEEDALLRLRWVVEQCVLEVGRHGWRILDVLVRVDGRARVCVARRRRVLARRILLHWWFFGCLGFLHLYAVILVAHGVEAARLVLSAAPFAIDDELVLVDARHDLHHGPIRVRVGLARQPDFRLPIREGSHHVHLPPSPVMPPERHRDRALQLRGLHVTRHSRDPASAHRRPLQSRSIAELVL